MIKIYLNKAKRYNQETEEYEYIDENLVDEKYYAGYTVTSQNQDDVFKAGFTVCTTSKVTLSNEAYSEIPEKIIIEDVEEYNGTLLHNPVYYGNVDSYEINDFTTTFNLVDNMVKFNFPYDASDIMTQNEDGSWQAVSLLSIFQDILSKTGVLASSDIDWNHLYQSNMQVNWFDNTYSARDYLDFIAEINCAIFYIDGNGELMLIYTTFLKDMTMQNYQSYGDSFYRTFDEIGDYKIGSKHSISRVVFDDTNVHYEFGDETGETYYINYQNVYCINEDIVQHIYNILNDFEFYDFKTDNIRPLWQVTGFSPFAFTDGTTLYKTFLSFSELNYSGQLYHGGMEFSVKNEVQQETEVIDQMKIIRGLKTIVDRDHNTITNTATQTEVNRQNLESFQESVQTQLSAQEYTINSMQTTFSNGVETLKNSLVTIDINGINVSTNTSAIATLLNNEKLEIKSGKTTLAYFGYDQETQSTKAEMANLTVTNYLVVGYHRIQTWNTPDNEEPRTGFFWIGE